MTQPLDPNVAAAYRLAQQANQNVAAQGAAIQQINRAVTDLTELLAKDKLSEEHAKLAKSLEADVEAGRISREEAVVKVAEAVADARARMSRPNPPIQTPPPAPAPQPQPNPMQLGAQAILASYGLTGREAGLQADTTSPQTFRASIEKFIETRKATEAANPPKKDDQVDVEAIRAQERKKLAEEYGIPLRDGGGAGATSGGASTVSSEDVMDIANRFNNRFHSRGKPLSRTQVMEQLQAARDTLAGKVQEVQTGERTYAASAENLARISAGGNPR